MVYKIFKKISLKVLFLQVVYIFFLSSLSFFLNFNKISFFAGLTFSYLYMTFFFFSIKLIFTKEKKALGALLLLIKWFLLLIALILVAWFLEGKAFLLGLSVFFLNLPVYILVQFGLLK